MTQHNNKSQEGTAATIVEKAAVATAKLGGEEQ
jgi:hypothetical protein